MGVLTSRNLISETDGSSFSIQSCIELSKPVVVQRQGHFPMGMPTSENLLSLKPLDGFSLFEVL